MGQRYYNCNLCDEAFSDYDEYCFIEEGEKDYYICETCVEDKGITDDHKGDWGCLKKEFYSMKEVVTKKVVLNTDLIKPKSNIN